MPDVQSSADNRRIAIQRVGVRGVRHPMLVDLAGAQPQATVAHWELTVALPAHEKGTHMSRFVALLEKYHSSPATPVQFCRMAQEMLPLLNAEKGDITAEFPFFLQKVAPVSGVPSLMDYQATWTARVARDADGTFEQPAFSLSLVVPVTSLCPCSKAISEYGAHNQRSHVTVTLHFDSPEGIDTAEIIRTVEQQASCELWGLLKRADEKYVTERAYENPKFVEDLVRDVADRLESMPNIASYRVVAENFESIHNHSAYAVIEG